MYFGVGTHYEPASLGFESSPIDAIFGVMLKERFTECLGRQHTPRKRVQELMRQPTIRERHDRILGEDVKSFDNRENTEFCDIEIEIRHADVQTHVDIKSCVYQVLESVVWTSVAEHMSQGKFDKEKSGDNENSVSLLLQL